MRRLLVANRGEIACRVMRSAAALGIETVAVFSEADAGALHVLRADRAEPIGPPPAAQSYLDAGAILAAARRAGADAVHPGYGFLAESAGFATRVLEAGLTWVGPDPKVMEALGDKRAARERMAELGVPVARGGAVADADEAASLAAVVGYPVIVKPAAGGGGIGMRVAADESALRAAVEATTAQAARFFGDGSLLVERYLPAARHVEIQVLGLGDGRVVALGERDCSVQRRWQKVVEESPSPGVDEALRAEMQQAASSALAALGYRGAGTVECLVSGGRFAFLEVNARLQVEHPVTEVRTGIDLVAEQLRVAAGAEPGFDPDAVAPRGHAIELRLYAEDSRRFLPSPGRLQRLDLPCGPGVRVDTGYRSGDEISRWYDPLVAKVVVAGRDREQALGRARRAVAATVVEGPRSNLDFLAEVLADAAFTSGRYDTGLVARMRA